jgi:hypothetical protein
MKILKDDDGQAVVLVASFLGMLALGFVALAVDVGFFFHEKRMAQSAADAAAIAAAEEVSYGDSSNSTSAAKAIAKLNGFDTTLATNPAVVSVQIPTAGNYSGSSSYVQVTVSRQFPTFFLGAFQGSSNMITIGARAVAGPGAPSSSNCIIGLNSTGVSTANAPIYGYPNDNADVAVSGGGSLKAPNCGVCGNSPGGTSVYAVGSGSITAASISSPGGDFSTGGGSITATNGVTQSGCSNPLAGKFTAPTLGACTDPAWMAGTATGTGSATSAGGAAETLGPGTYCNFNTSNVSALHLTPGTYMFSGNWSTNSGTTINCPTCTGGSGVFFYFAPGSIMNASSTNPEGSAPDGIGNGTTLNLTASTSGTWSGVLMWDNSGTSSSPDTFTFGGGSSSSLTGNMYMPYTNLNLGNGTNTGALSSLIVANSITVQGGSTVTDNATAASMASGSAVGFGLVE